MNNQNSRSERQVLLISAVGNLVIGVVGILFAVFSSSQAIMLDALFNLTYFATALFTLKVAKMVMAHVVLPTDFQVEGLPSLDAVRAETLKELKAAHLATVLDMVFTADPAWGAPIGLNTE
jgi:predicted Co/Zn/Cd cation transporter (cation efflux family)